MNTTTEQLSQKKKRINWKRAEGMKFGRWTVKSWIGKAASGSSVLECVCECGNTGEIASPFLFRGESRSCGCLRDEVTTQRNWKHGQAVRGHTTALFGVYHDMLKRCHSPTSGHPRYKGRGIAVCDRWRFGEGGVSGMQLFAEDMGGRPSDNHTIERRDNNGPYAPWNCVWGTRFDQSNNRCDTRMVSHGGKTMSLSRWSLALGIPRTTLSSRYDRGVRGEALLRVGGAQEL